MQAVLQFKEYHVVESIYLFDPFFQEEESKKDKEISPVFHYSIELNPKTNRDAWITLSVIMGDETLEGEDFFVRVRIMGRFIIRSEEEIDEDQIMRFYKINAVSILYPYLRSLVSDISSKGSRPPIILPTLNIVAVMEKYGNASELPLPVISESQNKDESNE